MFTGIVEEVGEVESLNNGRLRIKARLVTGDLSVSESICVAGACLTVVERNDHGFAVDVVPETVRRTNFGVLQPGSRLNLERSLAYGGRIGGHFVQGHVDDVADVVRVANEGSSLRVWLKAAPRIMPYVVEKGFVALDGVSLTVVDRDKDSFSIALIPYTRENTTFGRPRPGDHVNVEVDVTAKYVEQFVEPHLPRSEGS